MNKKIIIKSLQTIMQSQNKSNIYMIGGDKTIFQRYGSYLKCVSWSGG